MRGLNAPAECARRRCLLAADWVPSSRHAALIHDQDQHEPHTVQNLGQTLADNTRQILGAAHARYVMSFDHRRLRIRPFQRPSRAPAPTMKTSRAILCGSIRRNSVRGTRARDLRRAGTVAPYSKTGGSMLGFDEISPLRPRHTVNRAARTDSSAGRQPNCSQDSALLRNPGDRGIHLRRWPIT